MATTPLVFEIAYRREAYKVVGTSLHRDEARDAKLPIRPEHFTPMKGSHGPVSEQAERLNKIQTRSGFMDFFFFPQILDTPVNYGPRTA